MNTPFLTIQRHDLAMLSVLLLALPLTTLPTLAHAQLMFALTPDVLHGRPGDVLTFAGTLTNQGTDTLFLNGDNFTLPGTDLTLDDSPFLSNFPLSLLGGQSANGDMFTVAVGAGAPNGLFAGSFTILGGATSGDTSNLVTQSFSVAVPEPGTYALLLSGGVALGLVGRRRKAANNA